MIAAISAFGTNRKSSAAQRFRQLSGVLQTRRGRSRAVPAHFRLDTQYPRLCSFRAFEQNCPHECLDLLELASPRQATPERRIAQSCLFASASFGSSRPEQPTATIEAVHIFGRSLDGARRSLSDARQRPAHEAWRGETKSRRSSLGSGGRCRRVPGAPTGCSSAVCNVPLVHQVAI